MKENTKRLTIEIDEDVFYKLKKYCVENKTTFRNVLTSFIEDKIK